MILLVAAFLVSLLPSAGLFLWLRSLESDPEFKGICNRALLQGVACVLPIVCFSGTFALIGVGLSHLGVTGIAKVAYHNFIVLAFAEELSKYLMFRRLLAKYQRAWSWLDYIILMTIVGIGFGLAEDIPYAIGASPIIMIVRGVTCMHGGYGFIMGYFMGKAKKTGNRIWSILGLGLPWLLHGSYDFGLSEEFLALGDNAAFLSVSLAILALVILIGLIVFLARRKHDRRLTTPMEQASAPSAPSQEPHHPRHFA